MTDRSQDLSPEHLGPEHLGPEHLGPEERIRRLQERRAAASAARTVVDAPVDVAFECSGHADAAEAALDQLDFVGTLVFVGTGSKPPRINHNRMIIFELTTIGAYNYDAAGFGPDVELLASGALPLDALIGPNDVLLDEVIGTMHRLAAGELPGKVMVRPEVAGVMVRPEVAGVMVRPEVAGVMVRPEVAGVMVRPEVAG